MNENTLRFGEGKLAGIDLASPATHAERDLAQVWRLLREEQPVAWHPAGSQGFWVVTRYADVVGIYRDSESFTSTHGNVLATLLAGGDSAGGRMLAVSDGPRHKAIRQGLQEAFSRRALAFVTERIQAAARQLVRQAVERGECDFAADVAQHIPLTAICDLLGIGDSDRDTLFRHVSAALAADSPDATTLDARLARNEILLYFARSSRKHGEGSRGVLLDLMARLKQSPLALTEEEFLFNCYSLLLGGDETTRLALIGQVKALAENPGEWRRLRNGEVTLQSTVEEMLRWTTPALHSGRTAVREQRLHDCRIEAGQIVTIWNASANFDPDEFPDPHRLDLGRRPNRHLTFAFGPHRCLGALLARIELSAVLEALLETTEQIEVTGAPGRIYSNFLSGFSSLPVRLIPRGRPSL